MKIRDNFLDTIRATAIVMMVLFHFIYDLDYFNFVSVALFEDTIYIIWRYIIVSLFLSGVGISLVLVYANNFKLHKFLKRLFTLFLAASSVSIATYFIFPQNWIYFGILHMILTGSMVAIFFVRIPYVALATAVVILTMAIFNQPNLTFIMDLFVNFLPQNTVDFYPLFPWLAVILIGIFIAHTIIYKKMNLNIKRFTFLGRYSLSIYLSHQLVLFSVIGLAHYFLH